MRKQYAGVSNTLASAYTCVSKRARARRVGVRGSLARNKARTNNGAVAATAFPPQGTKAAIDRASTFGWCQGHPLPSAERSGANKKIGRVLYKGHDKSARDGCCTSLGMCVGKDGGE
ncbi:MAG: hypothetical protein ACKOE6_12590 [Flammeovirgaceae bacterium]